jgi:hypothetical protein
MDPGFLAGLAHMTSPPLTGVAKDAYPNLLGSLQYAAVCTRPDVSTALNILGFTQASPTDAHMHALKKVLRYLCGTIDMRLTLGGSTDHSLQLTGFADADWANDSSTRKSRSGHLFTIGRGPISYKSKQHTCVAQSTCEAEYYSAANATKEGLHLRQLMGRSSTPPSPRPPPSRRTTKAPLRTPNMPWSSGKTKHIGLKWHFLKDHVEQGTIKLRYLPTDYMVADMFTKPFPGFALAKHQSLEDKTQCNASSRSYLHGEYRK